MRRATVNRHLDARGDRRSSRRRTLVIAIPTLIIVGAVVFSGLGSPGIGPPGPTGPAAAANPTAFDPGATPLPSTGTPGAPTDGAPTDGAPSATVAPGDTPTTSPSVGPTSPEPEELGDYFWPLRHARLTAFFARRDDGFLVVDGRRIHEGIDMATWCGDRVRAAHDGIVLAAGRRAALEMGFSEPLDAFFERIDRRGSLNNHSVTIVIDDGNGYRSTYAHLNDVVVQPGDVVEAGDFIGYEGDTGNATGCHLHYDLFRMDGTWMAVAEKFVREELYPPFLRERIDPMRVLSLDRPNAPYCSGAQPPRISPGLGRSTAERPCPTAPAATASPDPSASPEPSTSTDPSAAP